ncbi:MAG: IS1595 family transposase [Roseovarius sp.]|nr:IS1595 family transposase [Roseovarius sp.]
MAQKNAYLFRGRISERKFRDLLRLFALDITADRAAELTGLHHNTTLALYRLLRLRMAELAQEGCPFRGQVELDESYFGPTRQRGRSGLGRGRGVTGKVPVFGILERGGRVHCQIVKNCSKATLLAILEGRVELSAEVVTDGFRSYDGLVEAGFKRHHRINKYWNRDRAIFSENGVHINGIESFWSYAKRRHAKFNGLRRTSFPIFLKETEFRFNNRETDLYRILLRSCRIKPLRR